MPAETRDTELALVIDEWERLSRDEPWHVDPRHYGLDCLHEVIAAVLDVRTWGNTTSFAAEHLVRAATAHGDQRSRQGVPDDVLLREYHALRASIWRYLQRSAPHSTEAIAEVLRIDVAIGVATTVALRAYHRVELSAGGSGEADMLLQIKAVSRHLSDHLREGLPS